MIRKVTQVKTKRFDFTLENSVVTKALDGSDECIIEGYANTSAKDRVGDVVMPRAFEKALPTYMQNSVLLFNHDWADPCGKVLEAKITDKGLWIKARISDTRQDIKTLVREGCLRTFSIGYNEIDCDYDESTKTKYIKELELLEISIVTVPANTEAMFTVAEVKNEEVAAPQVPPKADDKKDEEEVSKTDDSAKSAPIPAVKTANQMKEFIDMVKSCMGRELEGTETVAVCDYFINVNKDEDMLTKEQLLAALKGKSAKDATPPAAPVPAPTEAKADEQPPAEQPQPQDMMKELMAKIDAIGQALAQIMESMAPKSDEQPPKDEPKPEDQQKQDEQPKDQSEEDEMSDDEVEKQLAEVESEIAALEDQLEI